MKNEEKQLIISVVSSGIVSVQAVNELKALLLSDSNNSSDIPSTVSSKEAMQVLGCSKQCLNKYLNQGKLKRYKISKRKIMIDKASLKELLK